MLRLRGAALSRSSPSLLRAAASDSCLCNHALPGRGPSSACPTATTAAAQRRWFGQTPNWVHQSQTKGKDDQREVQASFEQAHGLGDATSATGPDSAAAFDSLEAAVTEMKHGRRRRRRRSESGGLSKKLGQGPDKGVTQGTSVEAEESMTENPSASSAGGDSVDAALRMVKNAQPSGSSKKSGRRPNKGISWRVFVEAEDSTTKSPEAKAGAKKEAKKRGEGSAAKPASKKSAAAKPGSKKGAGTKGPARTPAKEPWEVDTADAQSLELQPLPHTPVPVPKLSYNLDRCLFKPGVYPIQDPRTGVFNFDPYLSTIMPINEFDYTAIKGFVSSSNDPKLIAHAAENKKKYSGSTSSMSAMLSHFHFLLSAWRPINAEQTSKGFVADSTNFTRITRAPAASFLRWRDGVYAVDADKQFDTANILSMLGKSLEKLLTLPKEEYEMYRRSNSDQLTEEQKNADESFHYTMLGDFILRSQLDAYDRRLPGEGMFDIKTRAVLPVRMDARGYEKGKSYEIRGKYGQFESFEREYYDMIRSAFLKYSLQVRMGRMDGIFVAYHNTERMFGFQYMPLEELDNALHGTTSTHLGDQEFKLSVHLLNKLLNRATEKYPDRPLRIHIEARPTEPPLLYFFAKPVTEERIEEAQKIPKAEVEKFERELMGYAERSKAAEEEEVEISEEAEEEAKDVEGSSLSVAEMNQKAEEAVENDELGVEYVRRSIERALERSGLVHGKSPDEVQADVEALLEMLTNGADAAGEEGTVVEEGTISPEDLQGEEGGAEGEKEQQAQETSSGESDTDAAEPPAETGDQTTEGFEKSSERSTAEPGATEQQDGIEAAFGKNTTEPATIEGQEGIEAALDGSAAETEPAEEADAAEQQDGMEESKLDELILRLMNRTDEEGLVDETAADEEAAKVTRFKQALSDFLTESQKEQDGGEGASDPRRAAADSAAAEAEAIKEAELNFDSVEEDNDELLGMIMTVRNKVDGAYVTRPTFESASRKWTVEYSIQTMKDERAKKLYNQVKGRRRTIMADDQAERDKAWHVMFGAALPKLSEKGKEFREQEETKGRERPVWVVGEEEERRWEDVFGKK